jgi:predicted DNA-binding protein
MPTENVVQLNFKIPAELDRQLRALAREMRRTITAEVTLALEAHLSVNGFEVQRPDRRSPPARSG